MKRPSTYAEWWTEFQRLLDQPENLGTLNAWRSIRKAGSLLWGLSEQAAEDLLAPVLELYVSTTNHEKGTSHLEASDAARQAGELAENVNSVLSLLFKQWPDPHDLKQEFKFVGLREETIPLLTALHVAAEDQQRAYQRRASLKGIDREESILVYLSLAISRLTGSPQYNHIERFVELARRAKGRPIEPAGRGKEPRLGDRTRKIIARFREQNPIEYRQLRKRVGLPPLKMQPNVYTPEEKEAFERLNSLLRQHMADPKTQ